MLQLSTSMPRGLSFGPRVIICSTFVSLLVRAIFFIVASLLHVQYSALLMTSYAKPSTEPCPKIKSTILYYYINKKYCKSKFCLSKTDGTGIQANDTSLAHL